MICSSQWLSVIKWDRFLFRSISEVDRFNNSNSAVEANLRCGLVTEDVQFDRTSVSRRPVYVHNTCRGTSTRGRRFQWRRIPKGWETSRTPYALSMALHPPMYMLVLLFSPCIRSINILTPIWDVRSAVMRRMQAAVVVMLWTHSLSHMSLQQKLARTAMRESTVPSTRWIRLKMTWWSSANRTRVGEKNCRSLRRCGIIWQKRTSVWIAAN